MDIRPDKLPLLKLVDEAASGKIVLPQFQRNFVWPRDSIQDLLLSILKGYFIGSFLMLDVDEEHNPFAMRPIAGVRKQIEDLRPQWLVLDGQQRITSIHYALTGPDEPLKGTSYPYRFFLDLRKLLEGNDEDLVFSLRSDHCDEYEERQDQFKNWILPYTELRKWTSWKDAYEDWLYDSDRDEHQLYRQERRDRWTKAIEVMTQFQVPVIEIPKVPRDDRKGISEVCAIFEKLNSTGIALSVFDLLTARLYKDGIDLHKLWNDAVSQSALLEEFSDGDTSVYGVYLLRTIALMRRQEVKASALVNLSPKSFVDDWNRAVEATEQALMRLKAVNRDGFGVFSASWQPYSTLVPVLATLLASAKDAKPQHAVYGDLKCWYWASVFLERYAGAVDSTSYRDAVDLLDRQEDPTKRPEAFADVAQTILDNPLYTLRNVSRNNSVYKGVMNLVAINGARDFENNDSISFHELEDHHIFPKAFLRDKYKIKDDPVNTILNRTLITSHANRRISRKRPSQYLKEILPDEHRQAILRSHLIGPEAQAAMEQDDYDAFLVAREKDILKVLKAQLEPAR